MTSKALSELGPAGRLSLENVSISTRNRGTPSRVIAGEGGGDVGDTRVHTPGRSKVVSDLRCSTRSSAILVTGCRRAIEEPADSHVAWTLNGSNDKGEPWSVQWAGR